MSDPKRKHNFKLEKCEFSSFTFPSGVLSHSFALQYFGFCTMWPPSAKGPLIYVCYCQTPNYGILFAVHIYLLVFPRFWLYTDYNQEDTELWNLVCSTYIFACFPKILVVHRLGKYKV